MSGINTSATGGYLVLSGQGDIDAFGVLQGLIAGVTGLSGDLIRPRWRFEPQRAPEADVTWIAVGLQRLAPIGAPQIRHDPAYRGEGYADDEAGGDIVIVQEELTVLVSVIGPEFLQVAARLSDGIYVPQNRHSLRPAGLAFVRAEAITVAPVLTGEHWQGRADLPLVFRRERGTGRAAVLNLTGNSEASFVTTQSGTGVPLLCGKQQQPK